METNQRSLKLIETDAGKKHEKKTQMTVCWKSIGSIFIVVLLLKEKSFTDYSIELVKSSLHNLISEKISNWTDVLTSSPKKARIQYILQLK